MLIFFFYLPCISWIDQLSQQEVLTTKVSYNKKLPTRITNHVLTLEAGISSSPQNEVVNDPVRSSGTNGMGKLRQQCKFHVTGWAGKSFSSMKHEKWSSTSKGMELFPGGWTTGQGKDHFERSGTNFDTVLSMRLENWASLQPMILWTATGWVTGKCLLQNGFGVRKGN